VPKIRADYSLEEDKVVVQAPAEAVPCTGCHANCCEYHVVPVTAHDIQRIADTLDRPMESFVQLHLSDEADGVHLRDGFFVLALRQREDRCGFLADVEGQKRCSIHAFKPGLCNAYPFKVVPGDQLEYLDGIVCPSPWTLSRRGQQSFRDDIRRSQAELAFHQEIVADWNATHPAGGELAEFAAFMTSAVERARPAASRRPGKPPTAT